MVAFVGGMIFAGTPVDAASENSNSGWQLAVAELQTLIGGISGDLATHESDPDAHHTKYTDAEAVAAVGDHTVKYTDAEAVAAVGVVSETCSFIMPDFNAAPFVNSVYCDLSEIDFLDTNSQVFATMNTFVLCIELSTAEIIDADTVRLIFRNHCSPQYTSEASTVVSVMAFP